MLLYTNWNLQILCQVREEEKEGKTEGGGYYIVGGREGGRGVILQPFAGLEAEEGRTHCSLGEEYGSRWGKFCGPEEGNSGEDN